MSRWKALTNPTEASEIAEAALVLPVLFTLLLGIFWIGRAYNVYATMNHAAREAARTAAGPKCATCGNTPYSATQIATQVVTPMLTVSRVDPALITAPATPPGFCQCGTSCTMPTSCTQSTGIPQITVCQNVDLGVPTYSPNACGTAVYFQYPFTLPLPYAPPSLSSFTLTGRAVSSTEQ